MLLALGVPACSSGVNTTHRPPAPPPPIEDNAGSNMVGNGSSTPITTPTPAVTPTPQPVVIASPAFDAACRVDTLPERVCGLSDTRARGSACGPSGDHIENYGPVSTYVTPHRGKPGSPLLRAFVLDPDATAAYQKVVTPPPDMVPRYCCWARCTPLDPVANPPAADVGGEPFQRCIPAPPAGTRVPHASNKACPASIKIGGAHESFLHGSDGRCCYQAYYRESPEEINERLNQRAGVKGRAARVAGMPIVAPTAHTEEWRTHARPPEVATLDPDVAAQLAAGWLTAAQMEHASVASFMALGLQLLALGAPPELVAACNRAALDEIEHARVAFELASAYAQRPLGPAPFPSAGHLSTEGDLSSVALHTFIDGCIAETTAALEAYRASESAGDPVVAAVLRQIADDETRHAELAWSIVGWCVRAAGPALVDAFRDIVAGELARSEGRDADRGDDLSRHGLLSDRTVASLRTEIVRDVVVPCLAALAA